VSLLDLQQGEARPGFWTVYRLSDLHLCFRCAHGASITFILAGVGMSKSCVMLICMLSVGFAGAAKATPPDSPDIVIVDGLPCNRLCRSYMAWSRELSSRHAQAQLAPKVVAPSVTEPGEAKSHHASGSRPLMPHPFVASRAKIAGPRPAATAAADSTATRAEIADSHPKAVAGSDAKAIEQKPRAETTGSQPAADASTDAAAAGAPPRVDGAAGTDPKAQERPPAKITDMQPAAKVTDNSTPAGTADSHAAAGDDAKAIREQVAAAASAAEQATTAAALPIADAKKTADADTAASTLSGNTDFLVAILIARPDIQSVAGLAGKSIAIDARHSVSNGNVKTAIADAGAAQVQLSEGQVKAVDRLIDGEVPAAVVALVSPKAAEGFPETAGFKTFRMLLWPRSSQLEKP
jgi:hypothetical protein